MRAGELFANLVFWLGTPAAAWWLHSQQNWSWWQALPTAAGAGTVAALLTSFVVGKLLD